MTATSKTMMQEKKRPQDIPETTELSYKVVCVSKELLTGAYVVDDTGKSRCN